MAFIGGFLHAPPACPFIDTLILWSIKGVCVGYIWVKFHLCLICTSLDSMFKCFRTSRNCHFRLSFGGFFLINPLNLMKFVLVAVRPLRGQHISAAYPPSQ